VAAVSIAELSGMEPIGVKMAYEGMGCRWLRQMIHGSNPR